MKRVCTALCVSFVALSAQSARAQAPPGEGENHSGEAVAVASGEAAGAIDCEIVTEADTDAEPDASYPYSLPEVELFQDSLPLVRGVRPDAAPPVDHAPRPPNIGSLPPDAIAQPAPLVPRPMRPRVARGQLVADKGARFQAQIAYAQDPRQWVTPVRLAAERPDWETRHVCGGSLIARDWVVTAAHCISAGHLARGLTVLLGAEDISKPQTGMTYRVDRAVVHAGYSKANIYRDDIALVHLVPDSRPRAADQIAPIALDTAAEPADGTPVSALGWGKTREAGLDASAVLWRADMRFVSAATCRAKPGYDPNERGQTRIGDAVSCAGETASKSCSGDSGGPLLFTHGPPRLVGIVSWNKPDCGNPANPGVYTRISSYAGWLRRAMATAPGPQAVRFLGN